MGTTLTGTTPQDTYDSLIKVTDNGPLSATAKRLSDGLGNDSTLYLSTTSVGIGVASPVETLEVGGTTIVKSGSGTTVLAVADTSTGGKQYSLISAGTGNVHSVPTGSFYIRNSSDGVTAMTLTSAGNVGIGVTPNDWFANFKGLQLQNGSLYGYSVNRSIFLTQNAFFNTSGSWIYSETANAAQYSINGAGEHLWYSAPSGTSGTAVTFTESMRILAGGGLTFNGDTAQANALDDYEEGTFTPFVSFSGGTTGITYSQQLGRYTKIGNAVSFILVVTLTNKGSSSGEARIEGLPFTIPTGGVNYAPFNIGAILNTTFNTIPSAVGIITTTYMVLEENVSGGAQSPLTQADFANNTEMRVSGTYFV